MRNAPFASIIELSIIIVPRTPKDPETSGNPGALYLPDSPAPVHPRKGAGRGKNPFLFAMLFEKNIEIFSDPNPSVLCVFSICLPPFRGWRPGAGEAGKYNAPGLPDIIGKYGQVFARPAVAEGPFAGSDIIAENVQGGTDSAIDYLVTVGFRASAANPTYGASATVMPSSINLPIILYMGIAT